MPFELKLGPAFEKLLGAPPHHRIHKWEDEGDDDLYTPPFWSKLAGIFYLKLMLVAELITQDEFRKIHMLLQVEDGLSDHNTDIDLMVMHCVEVQGGLFSSFFDLVKCVATKHGEDGQRLPPDELELSLNEVGSLFDWSSAVAFYSEVDLVQALSDLNLHAKPLPEYELFGVRLLPPNADHLEPRNFELFKISVPGGAVSLGVGPCDLDSNQVTIAGWSKPHGADDFWAGVLTSRVQCLLIEELLDASLKPL